VKPKGFILASILPSQVGLMAGSVNSQRL